MLENALHDGALTATPGGYELRLGLPWIRSMPLSCISGITVTTDGYSAPSEDVNVRLRDRTVPAGSLINESGWWFIQDRLVLAFPAGPVSRRKFEGRHHVSVDFNLLVPYLRGGGDAPLVLPIHVESWIRETCEGSAGAARDVA